MPSQHYTLNTDSKPSHSLRYTERIDPLDPSWSITHRLTSRHQALTERESLVCVNNGDLVPVECPGKNLRHIVVIVGLHFGRMHGWMYKQKICPPPSCLRSAIPIQTLKRRAAIGHFSEKYSHMYVYFCIVKEYAKLHRIRFIM